MEVIGIGASWSRSWMVQFNVFEDCQRYK